MAVFMIGYDLHEGEDYADLIDAIENLAAPGERWHCLDSTWFIVSDSDYASIRNALKPHLRNPDSPDGDRLLVVKVSTPTSAAWTKSFSDACINWIKKYL